MKLVSITNGHALPPIKISAPATLPSLSSTATTAVVTSSASTHGAITALTAASITIGDVTCPFNLPTVQLQVGQVISMSCKTYANGIRLGSIVLPRS